MLLISFRGSDVFLMRGRKSVDQDGCRGWKELRGEEFGGRVVRMEICPFVLVHLKLHLIQTSTSPVHIVSIFVNSYDIKTMETEGHVFLEIYYMRENLFSIKGWPWKLIKGYLFQGKSSKYITEFSHKIYSFETSKCK